MQHATRRRAGARQPGHVACGVVSAAVIVSGRHFALDRRIQGIFSIPASAHVPWALGIGSAARRSLICASGAAVAAACPDVLREFWPPAGDGGAHYRISNRVVTLFRSVSWTNPEWKML